jgi:hypothetical protein
MIRNPSGKAMLILNPRSLQALVATLAPITFATVACAQPVISETFDSGLNGWTFYADGSALTWDSTGGNPGGCAQARDLNNSILWGFSAPAAFRGDKSCYYGGTISWDVRSTHGSSTYANQSDILLISPSLTLAYNVPGFPVAGVWNSQSVDIIETNWHVTTFNGAVATEAQLRQVLANITDIRINCEWSASVDTGRMDNIVLTPGNECTPPCAGDFDNDNDADSDDVILFFAAWDNGDLLADVDGDSDTDSDDVIVFFTSWDAGC